jgi:hypothetical protein
LVFCQFRIGKGGKPLIFSPRYYQKAKFAIGPKNFEKNRLLSIPYGQFSIKKEAIFLQKRKERGEKAVTKQGANEKRIWEHQLLRAVNSVCPQSRLL